MPSRPLFCLVLSVVGVAPAQAQTARSSPPRLAGVALLGAASVPRFPGAGTQRTIPFVAGRVQLGRRYLATEGTGVRLNLLSVPWLEAGPAASLTFGRDAMDGTTIPGVDDAIEAGAFVATSTRRVFAGTDQLRLSVQATRDLSDAHDGWVGTAALGYSTAWGPRVRPSVEVTAVGGNQAYNATYFGTPTFVVRGGVQHVAASLGAVVALDGGWLLTGFGGIRRLVGDAANSPVTALNDGRSRWLFGAGVGRAF